METRSNIEIAKDHLIIAKDKLEAAKILFHNEKYNESVSRAYYSVFHSLKAALYFIGIEAKTHKGLFYNFYKEFVSPGIFPKDKYRELNQLQRKREDADYGLIVDLFVEEDAHEAIELAVFVYEFVEKIITEKS